jgi:hypothetical protein
MQHGEAMAHTDDPARRCRVSHEDLRGGAGPGPRRRRLSTVRQRRQRGRLLDWCGLCQRVVNGASVDGHGHRRIRAHARGRRPARRRRVFWVVDNGSSHAGRASIQRMSTAWPTATLVHLPVHASRLNQIEIVFSVIQRKVVKPADFADLDALAQRLSDFEPRYNATATPFDWSFSRADLDDVLHRLDAHRTADATTSAHCRRWVVAGEEAGWSCGTRTLFRSIARELDHGQRSTVATARRLWTRGLLGPCEAAVPARSRLRGAKRDDVEIDGDPPSETERLRAVLKVLTRHTRTPDDCYFCLWDGWGSDIEGDDGVRILHRPGGTVRERPQVAPAFPPSVLRGPKVVVPNRSYYLFRGAMSDFGDWGAAEMWPGKLRPIPRSSGRPSVSPMTSTHTGPGSELTSRSSTSCWLIQNSTSSQPTHARTSLPTGRPRKGQELLSELKHKQARPLPTAARIGTAAHTGANS